MNIVFGVSGEGLGHSFEAIEIIRLLQSRGHAVKVLTFGDRACDCLKDFHPTRIEGFSLHVDARGGLSLPAILFNNTTCLSFYMKNWRRLRNELRAFSPDVFITSYEPVTTLFSHVLRKPLISMDNQNALLYMKKPPGASLIQFTLAKMVTRAFTYGASHYIIKSLTPGKTTKRNVCFVSPQLQEAVRDLSPTDGDHILVYLTQPNQKLIQIFKSMTETFIVYCNNQVGVDQNITYRAPGPGYLADLASCKAIIATTGFSLINDAIYLQKPYFGVPIKRHFEQINNAYFLRDSGLGEFSLDVGKRDLELFLSRRAEYQARMRQYQLDHGAYGQKLLTVLDEIDLQRAAVSSARGDDGEGRQEFLRI